MCLVGLLLLCAAVLKGYQIASQYPVGHGVLGSRTANVALVEFELALAGLLILCPCWRITWTLAFTTFAAFAGVSLAMLARRAPSCGCFGAIVIHPLFALMLDIAVLALLAWAPPVRRDHPPTHPRSRFALPAFLVLFALGATFAFLSLGQPVMGADGIVKQGSLVVMDPTKWIDKDFPLTEYLDKSVDLGKGTWTVIIYRAGCSACRELLEKRRLTGAACRGSPNRLALIEVPGGSWPMGDRIPDGTRLRLDPSYEWQVRLPVEMHLIEGVVRSIGP